MGISFGKRVATAVMVGAGALTLLGCSTKDDSSSSAPPAKPETGTSQEATPRQTQAQPPPKAPTQKASPKTTRAPATDEFTVNENTSFHKALRKFAQPGANDVVLNHLESTLGDEFTVKRDPEFKYGGWVLTAKAHGHSTFTVSAWDSHIIVVNNSSGDKTTYGPVNNISQSDGGLSLLKAFDKALDKAFPEAAAPAPTSSESPTVPPVEPSAPEPSASPTSSS